MRVPESKDRSKIKTTCGKPEESTSETGKKRYIEIICLRDRLLSGNKKRRANNLQQNLTKNSKGNASETIYLKH